MPVTAAQDFSAVAPAGGPLRASIVKFVDELREEEGGHRTKAALSAPWGSLSVVDAMDILLGLLVPCLEDARSALRVSALNLLTQLDSAAAAAGVSLLTGRQVKFVVSSLPSSLLWDDAASAALCAPLLARMAGELYGGAGPPALSKSASIEWDGALRALLKAARRQTEAVTRLCGEASFRTRYDNERKDEQDEDEDKTLDKLLDSINAAAGVITVIPQLSKHRLLPYASDFATIACALLVRAATALSIPDAACAVADALCDLISVAWCLHDCALDELRVRIFTTTLSAVRATTESHPDPALRAAQGTVKQVCVKVVARLAVVRIQPVLTMMDVAKQASQKYALHTQAAFLDQVNSVITAPSFKPRDAGLGRRCDDNLSPSIPQHQLMLKCIQAIERD